ncbi:MYC binding protein, transcript variant X1 [Ictidomys tridecemlineatus]|nr:MYC binding protein, transcript variant X1 [Ictidomys tridecemlineatus]
MSSAPPSPPATVSGASYAAAAVTMAHYKAADSKREQFRRYLEKSGVLDTLTKVLVALYEEPEKPNSALDFLKHHLGAATPENPEIELLRLELAEMKEKYEATVEENKKLKAKVVFHKMSPNETLFLESTNKIYKDDISNSSFVNFQIWDFPGQMDFFDPTFDYEMIFRGTGALIYVIDAQDDYMEALTRLHITVSKAYKVNLDMNFEVFIHKVDGLSDDHKIETQRDIHQRANDDLADAGLEKLHLSFYLTSIYDHSIFEAFSKVVQKLIPQLPTLENLLNIFISNSGIEKAFLFDVVSKIYIATDSSPVDMQSYELCCDMIDVVIDVSCIYGLKEDGSGSAYDKESMAIIKLNNTTVLYLKEVTKFLALVCILREESFERKGLIDYNFHCFRKAIHEVFEVGVTSHRSCSHQISAPSLKALAHNGTPRNAI